MKKILLATLSALAILMTISSCTTSDYISEYEIRKMIEQAIKENNQNLEFTQWEIVNIPVKEKDWEWNEDNSQWEVFADLPELTEFIYEKGAALGFIFLGTQGKDEVQKPMPYSNSYYDGKDDAGNDIKFTETISCDFQLGKPSTVGFFIQSSDLFKDDNAPNNYNFRVVLIW